MERERFENWLRDIYETQDREISCTECFDLISHFVGMEISDRDPRVELPHVRQHLNQCPACRAEYETLHDLADLENQGNAPSVDDLSQLID